MVFLFYQQGNLTSSTVDAINRIVDLLAFQGENINSDQKLTLWRHFNPSGFIIAILATNFKLLKYLPNTPTQ